MSGESHKKSATASEMIAWTTAAAMACGHYGVALSRVIGCRGRATRAHQGTSLLDARRAAVYLASVGCNLSTRAVCRAASLDRATVQHHLTAVEDDREMKASLDLMLDDLADRLMEYTAALKIDPPSGVVATPKVAREASSLPSPKSLSVDETARILREVLTHPATGQYALHPSEAFALARLLAASPGYCRPAEIRRADINTSPIVIVGILRRALVIAGYRQGIETLTTRGSNRVTGYRLTPRVAMGLRRKVQYGALRLDDRSAAA